MASETSGLMDGVITASELSQVTKGDFLSDVRNSLSSNTTKSYSFLPNNLISILNIVLLLVILSILGINVLGYTENVIQTIIRWIEPLFKYFGYSIISLTDKTVEQSRKGTKFAVDAIADTTRDVLRNVDDLIDIPSSSAKSQNQIKSYDRVLAVNGDEATSEIQRGTSSKSKAGYCYIGTDNGVRSCVKVNEYQKCMSGEVFPRMDICINPNLRT